MNDLLSYVSDPRSAEHNFALGLFYENANHTAAAAGFYVRTAEYSANDLLAYEALLRLANCFTKQGSRVFVTKGILLRAISLIPDRPEAYFLISELYEHNKDWQEAYSFAVMGQKLSPYHPPLRTNVNYPGPYALKFEQAVAGWWIGLFDESDHLYRQLEKDPTMLPIHITAVQMNLKRIGETLWRDPLTYDSSMYERLRVKFPGSQTIERNYSQAYQDMFVLTMLDGKRDGLFLEIGCGDPAFGNNTKLLEEWGWTGTSIDINPEQTAKFSAERGSAVITADATRFDFDEYLGVKDWDYLQIDVDPALNSLTTLLRIPFEKHRFAVITFEHDDYCSPGIKERSRQYLRSHGYMLVVGDIAPDNFNSFEDWWVHPDLIDPRILSRMFGPTDGATKADRYMLL